MDPKGQEAEGVRPLQAVRLGKEMKNVLQMHIFTNEIDCPK